MRKPLIWTTALNIVGNLGLYAWALYHRFGPVSELNWSLIAVRAGYALVGLNALFVIAWAVVSARERRYGRILLALLGIALLLIQSWLMLGFYGFLFLSPGKEGFP
jgi:hypothetical protein